LLPPYCPCTYKLFISRNTNLSILKLQTTAVRAIKNCVNEGMFVEVSMTVTKYNINDVPKMIEFSRGLVQSG